ncbi:hypothetical protein [Cereibacter changlensis]|uniref:hypothetical protein n=1 Tax=Cereibacter changlensis TaxID=402884 RepID=UPI0015E6ABB7|nr:hypothetical protein [Cereibacter changlensis]
MRDGGSDKVNAGRERAEDHAGRALPRAAFPQFLAALAHVAARNREAAAEAAADNLLI